MVKRKKRKPIKKSLWDRFLDYTEKLYLVKIFFYIFIGIVIYTLTKFYVECRILDNGYEEAVAVVYRRPGSLSDYYWFVVPGDSNVYKGVDGDTSKQRGDTIHIVYSPKYHKVFMPKKDYLKPELLHLHPRKKDMIED